MKQNSIDFFVCRHGYGHLKRVLTIVNCIKFIQPNFNITIHCHKEVFLKLINWTDFKNIKNDYSIHFEFNLMSEAPVYDISTTIKNIDTWIEKVYKSKSLIDGLVVIDNDASLLRVFPNAIMMSSFLWSEVLINSQNEESFKIAQLERKLLLEIRPFLLCVSGMTMPYLSSLTNEIKLPWMTSLHPNREKIISRNSILVTGGGTNKQLKTMSEVALKLKKNFNSVYVDSQIHEYLNKQIDLFGFEENDFSKLMLIVCRPGMGKIHDCIRYGIPIFAIPGITNTEMIFNATQISKKGIGINACDNNVVNLINKTIDTGDLEKLKMKILEEKGGGAIIAAKWIINYINERHK